ncbi:hypothetical protein BVG81_009340 [Haliangium sp. UPWRP_2]|nr:hypothetical protein BVG81_009340 [Haliangium sp. UPWRP_2]
MNAMQKLVHFLQQLETHHIWYRLEHIRESVLVLISIPGERWEVEFFPDGQVEVEKFTSKGKIENETALDKLWDTEA